MSSSIVALLLAVVVAIGGTGCRKNSSDRTERTPKEAAVYAAPRWPSYFKPPQSIEDLMPAARSLVRNKSGFLGVGMGVLQSGETVLIAPTASSDPMVVEAIVTALKERGVATDVKYTYELLGMTREQVDRQNKGERSGRRIAEAFTRRRRGSRGSFRIPRCRSVAQTEAPGHLRRALPGRVRQHPGAGGRGCAA